MGVAGYGHRITFFTLFGFLNVPPPEVRDALLNQRTSTIPLQSPNPAESRDGIAVWNKGINQTKPTKLKPKKSK